MTRQLLCLTRLPPPVTPLLYKMGTTTILTQGDRAQTQNHVLIEPDLFPMEVKRLHPQRSAEEKHFTDRNSPGVKYSH
jgi:hypothetical protein